VRVDHLILHLRLNYSSAASWSLGMRTEGENPPARFRNAMTPISRTPAKSISPVCHRSTLFVSRRFSGRIGGVVTARRMEREGRDMAQQDGKPSGGNQQGKQM
jgi:hypothetical protein